MRVEIITTGTEILLGQIVNTNSVFLSQKLNELGFSVLFHSTVGDNRVRMHEVLKNALERADIIITSGGLGPTQGDITKEVCANLLGIPLVLHEESVQRIKEFFNKRKITMADNNLRQAMIPEGAIVINNDRGTAPGVVIEHDNKIIINLPGPPHELEYMFEQAVIPYLCKRCGIQGVIMSRILHTSGIGESTLEENIKEFILAQSNPTIALLARKGEVIIRLTAKAHDGVNAKKLLDNLECGLRKLINQYIWGIDDDTLESVIGDILIKKQLTISLAESCTGGQITSAITDVSGSSSYLIGSIVCYSNEIKVQQLGIPRKIIDTHGAVSEETANYMAANIRSKFNTNIGVGITGIAGPTGATAFKPVGTVYIAIDGPLGSQCKLHTFTGNRQEIKFRATLAALHMLLNYIKD